MASESKKPRLDESQQDSSILMNTDILDNSSDGIEKKELYKLPIDKEIDFTIKSHLTDATFVIEGKKIYAGSDFLSLHSSYFNVLLKGGSFAESNQDEIELEGVKYDDFLKMLQLLVHSSKKIQACDAESLLSLGDRFDIKCLVDLIEEFLIKCEISISTKLLLADRYRLIKLQASCINYFDRPYSKLHQERVTSSKEFALLSGSAKAAFHANIVELESLLTSIKRVNLAQVEKSDVPLNGFIAEGSQSFTNAYERSKHAIIDIGGLTLKVYEGRPFKNNRFIFFLDANENEQSSVNWSIEGFVEVKIAKLSLKTGEKDHVETNTFAFSFTNSEWSGRMRFPAQKKLYGDTRWSTRAFFVNIYVTKVCGVRRNPTFDFTVPSELTDSVFIVEGKKIHVNKQYLSTISPRFHCMFYDTNEVEVKDVTYKDFIKFLYWMYPSDRRYSTDATMFSVLHVAEKLEVDINKSMIADYFSTCDSKTSLSTMMIFYFEFNCGTEADLESHYHHGCMINRYCVFNYNIIKHCPLLVRMNPEKKAKMYEFIIERMLGELDETEDYDSDEEDSDDDMEDSDESSEDEAKAHENDAESHEDGNNIIEKGLLLRLMEEARLRRGMGRND